MASAKKEGIKFLAELLKGTKKLPDINPLPAGAEGPSQFKQVPTLFNTLTGFGSKKTMRADVSPLMSYASQRGQLPSALKYNPLASTAKGRLSIPRTLAAGAAGYMGLMDYLGGDGTPDTGNLTPAQLAEWNRLQQEAADAELKSQFYPSQESYAPLGNFLNALGGGVKPAGGVSIPSQSYGNVIDAYAPIYSGGYDDVSSMSAMLPESGTITGGNMYAQQVGQAGQDVQNATNQMGASGGGYASAKAKETQNYINTALMQAQLADKAAGDADWRQYLLSKLQKSGANPYLSNQTFTGSEVGLTDALNNWTNLDSTNRAELNRIGINTPFEYYNYLISQNPTKYAGQ
jgi:hypothetical protein